MNLRSTAFNHAFFLDPALSRAELLEARRMLAADPRNVLAEGDFNGDGRDDMVVATRQGAQVLLAGANGNFQRHQNLSLGRVRAAVTGDFDGDGDDDLAVLLKQGGQNGGRNHGGEDDGDGGERQGNRRGNRLLATDDGDDNGNGSGNDDGGEICVIDEDDDDDGGTRGRDDDKPDRDKPDRPKVARPRPDPGPAPFPDDTPDGDNDGGDGPGPRDGDRADEFADPEIDDRLEDSRGSRSARVVILLNDEGTLELGQTLNVPASFSAKNIRATDLDGDDNLDLVLSKRGGRGGGAGTQGQVVLSGNGDGTFDAPHVMR